MTHWRMAVMVYVALMFQAVTGHLYPETLNSDAYKADLKQILKICEKWRQMVKDGEKP